LGEDEQIIIPERKKRKEKKYKIKTKQEHDKPKELEEKMTSKKP
jgi:hypothetical protein